MDNLSPDEIELIRELPHSSKTLVEEMIKLEPDFCVGELQEDEHGKILKLCLIW